MSLSLNSKLRILTLISYIIIFAFLYGKTYFSFFALNLLLAYIPFEISNLTVRINNKIIVVILSIIWLLYYPNSPYIVTDYVHIEVLNLFGAPFSEDLISWLYFSFSTLIIMLGFSLGLVSLVRICKKLKSLFFKTDKSIIIMIIIFSIIAGFGIYLGRFPRLHTTFLFENPLNILKIIFKSININSVAFSFIMAIWQIPFALLILKKVD